MKKSVKSAAAINAAKSDHFETMVELAEGGSIEDARYAVQELCEHLESGQIVPWPLAHYFSSALRAVLEGDDPAHRLNLVGKTRGRHRGKTVTHDLLALAAAHALLLRHGVKTEEANKILADKCGTDRRTIQRACKEYYAFRDKNVVDCEILKANLTPALSRAIATALKKDYTKR
jgi:hypothetical protein